MSLPASCHPDRPELSLGLCRECYGERRRRSMAAPVRPEPTSEERAERAMIDSELAGDEPRLMVHARRRGHMTAMQERTLRLLATGVTAKEAAETLGISAQTVKNHLTGAYESMGTRNLLETMVKKGWVRVPDGDEAPDWDSPVGDYVYITARELRKAAIAIADIASMIDPGSDPEEGGEE